MPLACEQPLLNIHTLHLGVIRRCPNMYLCPLLEQIRRLGARRVDDVVDVHLVQADLGLVRPEELLADVGEIQLRV